MSLVSGMMCKCSSRSEQMYLVVGTAILFIASLGVCKFGLGMGNAGMITETSGRSQRKSVAEFSYYGYMIFGVGGLLALVFGFMCVLNAIRFLTGTGLADANESW